MQAPGDLVAAIAELAAAVQLGEHDVEGGKPGLLVDVDRDAPAVVGDLDDVALQQLDHDRLAVATEGLVDGVVDDLPDQVVQATRGGRPDVHAGAQPDRFEPLEDPEIIGCIGVGLGCHLAPYGSAWLARLDHSDAAAATG